MLEGVSLNEAYNYNQVGNTILTNGNIDIDDIDEPAVSKEENNHKEEKYTSHVPNHQISNSLSNNEKQLYALLSELKNKRQQQPNYWDKLFTKRKDMIRFVQSALIIVLAISINGFFDKLLKHYVESYEISFNREMIIRGLYAFGVVFIAWNIITFSIARA